MNSQRKHCKENLGKKYLPLLKKKQFYSEYWTISKMSCLESMSFAKNVRQKINCGIQSAGLTSGRLCVVWKGAPRAGGACCETCTQTSSHTAVQVELILMKGARAKWGTKEAYDSDLNLRSHDEATTTRNQALPEPVYGGNKRHAFTVLTDLRNNRDKCSGSKSYEILLWFIF